MRQNLPPDPDWVDEVAVERACRGQQVGRPLTRDEQRAVVHHFGSSPDSGAFNRLLQSGLSRTVVCTRMREVREFEREEAA